FRRPSLESVWVALGLAPEQEPIARMSPEPVPERIARALQVAAVPRPGREPSTATVRDVAPDGPAPHIVVDAADDSPAALVHAARRSPHTAARLRSGLESTGPRPALAWYGEAARIELSGHVVANWVIKAIGHLHDEIALDPDDEVVVDLPPHWKRLTLAVAC